jgi:hypothetical protein
MQVRKRRFDFLVRLSEGSCMVDLAARFAKTRGQIIEAQATHFACELSECAAYVSLLAACERGIPFSLKVSDPYLPAFACGTILKIDVRYRSGSIRWENFWPAWLG